jgi:alkaline phosphatase D
MRPGLEWPKGNVTGQSPVHGDEGARYITRMPNRRNFLRALAALAAAAAGVVPTATRPRFVGDPFRLGIASGYPLPGSVVLWTRLVVDPRAPSGGIDPVAVPVRWEVARDKAMRDVVCSGTEAATPAWAHSVHVVASGLEPSRWYWYRFTAGNARSPIGRTRTAPAAGVLPVSLRFAVASCQHYEFGVTTRPPNRCSSTRLGLSP